MSLTEKYKELVDIARSNSLSINETGKVLRIEGEDEYCYSQYLEPVS